MTQQISPVICDSCGGDITINGNCNDYRLVLRSESKTPWFVAHGESGGILTSMYIPDPLPKAKHFCDIACLRSWISEQ